MKDYQLQITIQNYLSDLQKDILKDYWNKRFELTPKEIIEKYKINSTDLNALIKLHCQAELTHKCLDCNVEFDTVVTSRYNLNLMIEKGTCSNCLEKKRLQDQLERAKRQASMIADQQKKEDYYRDQKQLWDKKKVDALRSFSWLNLDEDCLEALKELYKGNLTNGRNTFSWDNLPIKLRMYLKLFDNLGLLHLTYNYNNPKIIDEILLNESVFQNLYYSKRIDSEFSIHMKINENANSPTSPSFRNTIKFDTMRVLDPNRSYACALWQLPDGSMNLKITPADQIVKRAEEIE